MTFQAEIKATLGWRWDDGARDINQLGYEESLAEGNGDNQAEAVWHLESQVLLDGNSTTLDLTALTRTILGDTLSVTFLTVKALMIVNQSTGAGELLIGGAASDEWSEPFGADGDQATVPPDSTLLLTNRKQGWDVDSTNKNLELTASGGDVTFSIAMVGTITVGGSGP